MFNKINADFYFLKDSANNEKQTLTKQQKESEKKSQQDFEMKMKVFEQKWNEKLK